MRICRWAKGANTGGVYSDDCHIESDWLHKGEFCPADACLDEQNPCFTYLIAGLAKQRAEIFSVFLSILHLEPRYLISGHLGMRCEISLFEYLFWDIIYFIRIYPVGCIRINSEYSVI